MFRKGNPQNENSETLSISDRPTYLGTYHFFRTKCNFSWQQQLYFKLSEYRHLRVSVALLVIIYKWAKAPSCLEGRLGSQFAQGTTTTPIPPLHTNLICLRLNRYYFLDIIAAEAGEGWRERGDVAHVAPEDGARVAARRHPYRRHSHLRLSLPATRVPKHVPCSGELGLNILLVQVRKPIPRTTGKSNLWNQCQLTNEIYRSTRTAFVNSI